VRTISSKRSRVLLSTGTLLVCIFARQDHICTNTVGTPQLRLVTSWVRFPIIMSLSSFSSSQCLSHVAARSINGSGAVSHIDISFIVNIANNPEVLAVSVSPDETTILQSTSTLLYSYVTSPTNPRALSAPTVTNSTDGILFSRTLFEQRSPHTNLILCISTRLLDRLVW